MKKIITILSFAALLFSCAKPINQPEVKLNTYIIEADLSSDDTKINYKDGMGYQWAGGEKIAVVNVDSGLGTKTESDGVGSDTQDAQFSVTVANGSYIAVHPETVGIQGDKLQFEFLANQRQTFGGETYSTIYDGSKRIPLVSQTKFELNGGSKTVSEKFNPVGALIRFSIYGGNEGEQIRSVSVVAPAGTAIAGTVLYSCSFDGDALTVNPDSYSNTTNKVRVLVHEDAYKAGAADAPSIFATIIPASFVPTYIVETQNALYTFASAKTKNFETSNRYDVKLNLQNGKVSKIASKVPQQLFIVGDGTSVGWTPENGIEMTRTVEDGKVIFTKDLIMFHNKDYRFLCTNLCNDSEHNIVWGDGYFMQDGNLIRKDYNGNNFIVNEGTGWYTLKVTFNDNEATTASLNVTRKAPYFVGATTDIDWKLDKAAQMMPVTDADGVFYVDIDWKNNGGEFKFIANNTSWDHQYISDGERNIFHRWYGGLANGPTYAKYGNTSEGKWDIKRDYSPDGKELGYQQHPSVTYILDTKEVDGKMSLVCVPQFCLVGGNWDGASWDNRSVTMTMDYKNKKAYQQIHISDINNITDFKICSKGTWGWGVLDGIWFRWSTNELWESHDYWFNGSVDEKGVSSKADVVIRDNDQGDAKYDTKFKFAYDEGKAPTGDFTLILDWHNYPNDMKLYYIQGHDYNNQ